MESDSQPNLRAPYPSWLSSSLFVPSNECLAVLFLWLYSFSSLTLDKRRILQEMLRVLSLSPLVPSSSGLDVSSFNYQARRHVLPPSSTTTRLPRENTTNRRAHGTRILARLHARVPAGVSSLFTNFIQRDSFEISDTLESDTHNAHFLEQRISFRI